MDRQKLIDMINKLNNYCVTFTQDKKRHYFNNWITFNKMMRVASRFFIAL
jgi:hypothetical protein